MRLFDEGYERVVKLTRLRRLDPSLLYRLSSFCVTYAGDGCRLLMNMLTGQVFLLEEGEWDALRALDDGGMTLSDLQERGLVTLVEHRSVVEEGYDGLGQYMFLSGVLKTMRTRADGLESYVLFPTTGCNARCTYCFEQGFAIRTMDDETARAVAAYLDRTRRRDATIRLRWFGGEPLVAASRIDLICRELEARGVPFTSSIVTNASLVTPELARRAKGLWRLTKAQVSLDGERVSYERRKRYVDPVRFGYDAAMDGVGLLLAEGVAVQLRCNYDADNLDGLVDLVKDVHARFGEKEGLALYFAQLFQSQELPEAPALVRAVRAAEDLAASYGLLGRAGRREGSFPLNHCMADAMDRCVVIGPDGTLQNCEHLLDDHRFGNVRDGVTDVTRFEELSGERDVDEACATCPFLPTCTPFRRHDCPDMPGGQCRAILEAQTQSHLRRLARRLSQGR